MSSRFLKKVTDIYGNNKLDASNEVQNEEESSSDNHDDSNSFTNKFSLLSNDLTNSEEDLQPENIEIQNHQTPKKLTKSKPKQKIKKSKDKFKDMTEEELLEIFGSMQNNDDVKDKINKSNDVLSLKVRNLNENIELEELFGPPTDTNSVQTNRLRQRNTNPNLKFTFGKRNANWPNVSFSKLGLTMECNESDTRNGKWCIVSCSKDYLAAERALKIVMRTGNFQDQLREFPYHINTLLQMATMLVHQEDFTLAADLWKRIFYVFETITPLGMSILGSKSAGSLSKINFSLDYRYRPNRGIFIALFQWILYLCQKSCFNTALEYCKVLLSVNIDYDPLAILLLIDDIAIRADQYEFLIEFHKQYQNKKSLNYLPNYAFSMSICYFFKSSTTKTTNSDLSISDDLLQNALCLFPTFLTSFVEHCNIQVDDKINQSTFFSKTNDPSSLDILIQLYMKRSVNFWKNTNVLTWLETNANKVLEKLITNSDEILKERKHVVDIYSRDTPLAIKRHLFLSGYGELAQISGNNLPVIIFDPFPPANSEGGFDHYIENDTELLLNDSWLMNFLRSFSPSFGV